MSGNSENYNAIYLFLPYPMQDM